MQHNDNFMGRALRLHIAGAKEPTALDRGVLGMRKNEVKHAGYHFFIIVGKGCGWHRGKHGIEPNELWGYQTTPES